MDYYTGVYVTAKDAKETVTNSDEYLSIINSVTSEIEAIKETRENARYQFLVDEATAKVNDAQKEFDDKNKMLKLNYKMQKTKLKMLKIKLHHLREKFKMVKKN